MDVPDGPQARLIIIHLQTEGLKFEAVNFSASFSAFMRSHGLVVTAGARGIIGEQALRKAQRRVTMQWEDDSAGDGRAIIASCFHSRRAGAFALGRLAMG